MQSKSQASLEFLTTYAWAFITLLITIGALYYFGVFDFSKFLPQKCLFPEQFECLDFSFMGDPTNEIRFKLLNNIGEKIDVDPVKGGGFEITNDASNPLTCAQLPSAISGWLPGTEINVIFRDCSGGVFLKGERTEAIITMNYCSSITLGCPVHQIIGKISAVVN